MALKITFEAQTDVGLERTDNQDHFGSSRQENVEFFIVCDGMGGHAGGSTASRLGVQAIENTLEEDEGSVAERMESAIHVANDAIHSLAAERRELRGMGTTVAMLGIDHETQQAHVAHVGDSRVYRLRGNTFERLTRDHTMVQRLVDEGIISDEEAEHHPQSNVISRSLGGHPVVDVEHGPKPLDLESGDIFLLCSDGLCGMVSEPEIAETLAHYPPEEATFRLIEQANDAGGHDNITAQIILIGEQAPPFAPEDLQVVHPPKGPSIDERSGRLEAAHRARLERRIEEELEEQRRAQESAYEDARAAGASATNEGSPSQRRDEDSDASGAPVLEDQSTGKLLVVLAGLIILLILLVIGLIFKTSPSDEEEIVVPEPTQDEDEDYPVYRRFDDSEPQPVYDVGYDEDDYGEVYDVYDVYDVLDEDGERVRKRRADLEDVGEDEDTGGRKNPFADDVGVEGGKNPAFLAPSRKNPFADDEDEDAPEEDSAEPSQQDDADADDEPFLEERVKRPAAPSKANPFGDADDDEPAPSKRSRTRQERSAPTSEPPVRRGENPF